MELSKAVELLVNYFNQQTLALLARNLQKSVSWIMLTEPLDFSKSFYELGDIRSTCSLKFWRDVNKSCIYKRVICDTFDIVFIFPYVEGSLAVYTEEVRSLLVQLGKVCFQLMEWSKLTNDVYRKDGSPFA
jgi:hypothetical protein